nr:hypothetical protein [Salmonella enterica]
MALENGINANLLFKWRKGKAAITFQLLPCDSQCHLRTARTNR